MIRNNGYIDINQILKELGIENTDINYLKECEKIEKINTKKDGRSQLVFNYNGDMYYYKYNINSIPYNELVAEELAKDYGIDHISYDLAIFNGRKGVISKNFKKENAKYFKGYEILGINVEENEDTEVYNNLESIWNCLEERYHYNKDKQEIVANLMNQIVNIFIFDIITCQYDRHSENWELMEDGKNISITPIYDNEGILTTSGKTSFISMTTNYKTHGIISSQLEEFIKISGSEFTDIIKDKLWIIKEENIKKILSRIELKTNYPIREDIKKYYLDGYEYHYNMLVKLLEEIDKKEENDYERKNR